MRKEIGKKWEKVSQSREKREKKGLNAKKRVKILRKGEKSGKRDRMVFKNVPKLVKENKKWDENLKKI